MKTTSLTWPAWKRFSTFSSRSRICIESTLLALALIWITTPFVVASYINHKLTGLPDYRGQVGWVEIHPWSAGIDIYNFQMDKKEGEVPLPFFFSPRMKVSLQWSQLLHGSTRSSVIFFHPRINLVAGPTSSQSQLSISMIWINTIKDLIPWRINQLKIYDGELHFLDFHASPKVDLVINKIQAEAENMSNSKGLKIPLPATINIKATPLVTGAFEMNLAVNFDEKYATFTQTFRLEHVPAQGANSALKKYLKVEAKSGEIGLYSEMSSDKGVYQGYVKPFFSHLEFQPKADDKDGPGALWSGFLNLFKGLIENDKQIIATQTNISGRVDQPDIDGLSAVIGIFWNAYVEALRPGFDPTHSPAKPDDTVTTPKSAVTENEAKLLPTKAK